VNVALYMDEQVPSAITEGLKRRGIDVMTVQADGWDGSDDTVILERATKLGRVLFTRDEDFLAISADLQRCGHHFAGVIYAHQLRVSIGRCITDLELIATVGTSEDFSDQVVHLPFP
jgi:hypothetical protein